MFRSAFTAIVGRPSAGKSSLLNKLCGQKVSIVGAHPQTTRNSIRGIVNRDAGQIVFVDTPGLHVSEKKLNLRLQAAAVRTLCESDIILYMLDSTRKPGEEEEEACKKVLKAACGLKNTISAINKIDLKSSDVKTSIDFLKKNLEGLPVENIFEISALSGEGIEDMLAALFKAAPPGSPYYDKDCYTDQEVNFRVSEIIREKCINNLREELPHCIHVEVADSELIDGKKLWLRVFILTERESQKGIIVGAGGGMIKKIRLAALKDLSAIFDWKIELDIRVKVSANWRQNDAVLKNFR